MYEILSIYPIIDKNKNKIKTFHICEAPGMFISAFNHYIKTKTKIKIFDWKAQSLKKNNKTKNIAFGDNYGLIQKYPKQWLWGIDGSGDITKLYNIKYYKTYCKNVDIITSDCGVSMKNKKLMAKLQFSQILFILNNMFYNI